MRLKLWLFLLVAIFAASGMPAQSQCFTFTNNYAVYTSVTSDTTNIYTSTLVDGQGSMTLLSGQGCGSINYGSAQHTPQALNVISWGSSYVGGMQSGSAECPNCYLSETNNQSVAITPGTTYTYTWNGTVYCNFGGNIFSGNGSWSIKTGYAGATWKYLSETGTTCTYSLSCKPGTTYSCPDRVLYEPLADGCQEPGIETDDIWISIDGGTTKHCAAGVGVPTATVPGNCF